MEYGEGVGLPLSRSDKLRLTGFKWLAALRCAIQLCASCLLLRLPHGQTRRVVCLYTYRCLTLLPLILIDRLRKESIQCRFAFT